MDPRVDKNALQGIPADGGALRNHRRGIGPAAQPGSDQIVGQIKGEKVHHDGGNHLMDAPGRLQNPRQKGPQGAGQSPQDQGDQGVKHRRQGKLQRHDDGHQLSNDILPLRPDVEQTRPEGDSDSQTGHDQGGNGADRLPDVKGLGKGRSKQGAVGPDRIVPGHQHEDRPHHHAQQNGNDSQQQRRLSIGANKEIHDVASSPFPPAIMRPNSSSVTVFGST